jgi:CzcA family heavy metal efflux pump
MMRWIVGTSLQARFVVLGVAALLMVFGFVKIDEMPVDTLPEFSRPKVQIQTEALGLSAQEVEAMITTPFEADMLNGTPWAEKIRSVSIPGLSSIELTFEEGTDIMRARQMVQENMTEVFALPNVSKPPAMINPLSSTSRCLQIGLTSDKLSLIEMSVLARWTIVPRLMGLPGVANASIWGQRKRQLQVQVDPERLRNEDVRLMQIIKTTGNALWASPLTFLEASTPGTGGWIDTPNQRLGIRHLLPISKPEELAQVSIDGATSKCLGDVADIVENHQPLIGDAIIADTPSLMLIVEKFPWANTMEVTEEVEEALDALRPGLSGLNMDSSLFRPATYLELAIENLSTALLIGGVLAVVALIAFFFNWRAVLISAVAILVSVMAAGTVFYLRGAEVNIMVFAGLMLALSAVIDDAIIDTENIIQRLRQARQKGSDKSAARIIVEAVLEMRSSIVYATLIIVLAVVPVFLMKGLSGALFQPLAISYILALVSSMFVALTVTPVLTLMLLSKAVPEDGEPPLLRLLRRVYDMVFAPIIHRPRPAFVAVGVIALIGLVSLSFVHQESLLPNFKETDLVVRWDGSTSASHPAMIRITRLATRELRSIAGVRNVSAHVGRAVMSDKLTTINSGELWVSIDPAADYETTVAAVKEMVAGYPGLFREVLTYQEAKVREELTGTGESLVVRVYGEKMDIIRKKAEEVKQVLAKIDGIVDPKVQYPQERPILEIEVDLDNAKRYGLKPGDVRRAVTSLVAGIQVGSLFEKQKVFDVMVYGTPETRHSLTSIQELLIDTPSGGHVRLKETADVRLVPSPTVINRDAVARYIDVTANLRGRNPTAVTADIERSIRQVDFPLEYRAELLGEYAEQKAALERVLAFAIAAAIGIFLILQAFFRSWRLATVIFLTLPMAPVGGVLAAFLSGGGILFSLGSIIGFITVFGIAVRNGMTLISRYRNLERNEGEPFGAELVQRATRERSAPILMTAVTTALVFLPLALFGNSAGLEIVHPMAIVVLGGLVTATLLSLVGVPAMYLLFGAAREPELELVPVTVVDEKDVHAAM